MPSRRGATACELDTGSLGEIIAREVEHQTALAALPPALELAVRAQFETGGRSRQGPWTLFGLLALYAFESAGGETPGDAAPAAAAIEFAAAAGSVLDDLQDLDPVAGIDESRPGAGAELVTLLMVLSQLAMASLDRDRITAERVLAAQATLSTFELRALMGQRKSIDQSKQTNISLEDSIEAAHSKSGSFGQLAAEVGASLATEARECVARHGKFGRHAAVTDQMQNDVAGVWPGGRGTQHGDR